LAAKSLILHLKAHTWQLSGLNVFDDLQKNFVHRAKFMLKDSSDEWL
jgi:hypothetical protein